MDRLGNNDESMRLRMTVVKQIEQAFADNVYPGDDKLVSCGCYECSELAAAFQGKYWTELTDVAFLRLYEAGLSLFQQEAFRFYLPAYIRAALVDPGTADFILEGISFSLTPPHLMTYIYNDSEPQKLTRAQHRFQSRVEGFTREQAAAIKAYFELFAFLYPNDAKFDQLDEVIPFWDKYPKGLESMTP
jgi:hypothetical protein